MAMFRAANKAKKNAASSFTYDMLVIGAGSAGVRAARIAAGKHGAKVALIEASMHHGPPTYTAVGGTCVNVGCVPKKLMVYGSHYSHDMTDAAAYGWSKVDKFSHDWNTLIARKNKEIDRLNGAYTRTLENAKVETYEGIGKILDKNTVEVTSLNGTKTNVTADTLVVAVGGWPFKPDIPGIEHTITSNEAFYLKEKPNRVVIVGGGYIAVEFACIFTGYGTKVTQLYRGEMFLRGFDGDIRKHLHGQMVDMGVDIKLKTDPTKIEKNADGSFTVHTNNGDTIDCDLVMYATGRLAKTNGIGLENAGVKTDKQGFIPVDDYSKTNVDNIYAIGDVTNRIQLTPVALNEGHSLADTLYGGKDRKPDHKYVASAVFSQPEIGTVGYTEEEAAKEFGNLLVYTSSFKPMLYTLQSEPYQRALMKIIVEEKSDRVVGVHLCCPNAGEIMQGVAIAVKMGAKKSDFDTTIGIHPTSAEEIVTMREPKYKYIDGKRAGL